MTKQVLVSITGNQMADEERDSIELVTVANYYKRNGHHFVMYEEMPEDTQEIIKNTLKFDETFFQMTKKGAVNSQMYFCPKQESVTYYSTPAGPMTINITTMEYLMEETENYIQIYIRYVLDINYGYSSENDILIRIASRR